MEDIHEALKTLYKPLQVAENATFTLYISIPDPHRNPDPYYFGPPDPHPDPLFTSTGVRIRTQIRLRVRILTFSHKRVQRTEIMIAK
jgi:hypothetical protein